VRAYSLRRETQVAADIQTVWTFVSNPRNLNLLTPPGLRFAIVSDPPDTIHDGLILEYRIRIPLFGTWSWLTEIKHIRRCGQWNLDC
jgi:ligand-binding SRPBCC domain-containing protein